MTNFTTTAIIHDARLEQVEKQLAKLSKLAVKLGLPAYVIDKSADYSLRPHPKNKNVMLKFVQLTVTGQRPVLDGQWSVMTKIEHTPAGNLLKGYSSDDMGPEYRTIAPACEHCNTRRNRKYTFILRNEAGKCMQVASTCIADFTGHENPRDLLALLDQLALLPEIMGVEPLYGDDEPLVGSSGSTALADALATLRIACELVSREGYISRARAYEQMIPSTADETAYHLSRQSIVVSKESAEKAALVLAWAKEQHSSTSTYLYNLSVIANLGAADAKNFGLLVSAVAAYDRAMAKAHEESAVADVYLGTAGDKLAGRLVTYTGVSSFDSCWGTTYIQRFTDNETGAPLVWKTSAPVRQLKQGETYAINGTIKEHTLYRDKKQTALTRVRCADLELFDKVTDLLFEAVADDADAAAVARKTKALTKKIQNPNTVNRAGDSFLSIVLERVDDSMTGWEPLVQALLAAGCDPHTWADGIESLANGSTRALELLTGVEQV